MTTPPEGEMANDAGPGEALRRAIEQLPAERTPPADAWAQLQLSIAAAAPASDVDARARRARINRLTVGSAIVGIAAMITFVLSNTLGRPAGTGPANAEAMLTLLPEERTDPRALAAIDETHDWRAASADSLRSARWPAQARDAIESALVSTEKALSSARLALRENPQDAAARDAIAALRSKQLTLLQHAMTLLDEI